MTSLELLAPAKNLQTGIAAIDHGADAVYIGAPRFGARAAAGNSIDDIDALCRYAHQFDARVFVTVNTLIYEDEIEDVRQLLRQLADISVDAVLVQDMQLLSMAKDLPLVLHASTQADNRTAEKVEWLHQHGFQRAVLARELSIEEITAIHWQVPQMELEVFVHGALCVSYSGLCYASEHCFHRSANRGECAQFCRMKFDLLDADGRELEHQRHLLSLKDLNLSAHLGRLIEAGATSFKIEGRLKDVSYVKNVTAAYSQLLDRYIVSHPGQYQRASRGRSRYTFQPDLDRTFNRGYTTYFVDGRQSSMASFDTPKAIGQCVGIVKELRGPSLVVAGTASFVNGDGLCFFDGRELRGFRVNRAEGNRLFPQTVPAGLVPGTLLYRSNDEAMERTLSRQSAVRKIPVTMSLHASADGFVLRMGTTEVSICQEHQEARTSQRDNIIRQLTRLGDTPYECTSVDIPDDFNYFIPSSQLSSLRRMAVEKENVGSRKEDVKKNYVLPPSTFNLAKRHIQISPSNIKLDKGNTLMQCRYCLRYELGFCERRGGRKPQWREPLFLRLADGRRFRLQFDCGHCQMNVLADA